MATIAKVKEKPISFSDSMVRAILAGRKTMTRRLIKHQPIPGSGNPLVIPHPAYGGASVVFRRPDGMDARKPEDQRPGTGVCPYGQAGRRLWVRETWRPASWSAEGGWGEIEYRADGKVRGVEGDWSFGEAYPDCRHPKSWRPSIFMPRWASRITLEIADIRVERLGDISEADKLAEGATPEMPFGTVWRKVHTKPGERFEDSPWTWVVEFRRA